MKNKNKLPEAGQYGSKHELSVMAKEVADAGQNSVILRERSDRRILSKIKRFFALRHDTSLNSKCNLLRMTKKRAAFTLAEVPEARQHGSKREAFTLAEVLITLGIIGIVAAMTIPTLTRAYKLRILKTQLNQAYSILSQSIKMMYAQSQLPPNCANYPNNTFVYELKKYLKNAQVCTTACTKHSDDDYYKSADYVTLKGDVPADYSLMDEGQLTLNNGMLVMIQNSSYAEYGIMLTVDINGIEQRPNK